MEKQTKRKEKSPMQASKKMIKTSLRFPEDLWKAARIRAIEMNVDAQTLVAEAVSQYLRKGGTR